MVNRVVVKDWPAHLATAEREGKPLARYAREHGLSVYRLYSARYSERRLAGTRARRSAFVPVNLAPAMSAGTPARVRASLPNGIVLEMHVGEQDAGLLGALVASLSRASCSG
jgi:hypothetical protein